MKQETWKVVVNGNDVPDSDRPVIGYWISGSKEFCIICTYDASCKQWQELDPDGECYTMVPPDYWIDIPPYITKEDNEQNG